MKSILLDQREVKGLLDGTITLLRRPVDHKTIENHPGWFWEEDIKHKNRLAPYQPEDILYGKETWIPIVGFRDDYEFGEIVNTAEHTGYMLYDGTRHWPDGFEEIFDEFHLTHIEDGMGLGKTKWRSSTQMPKDAARIFLKVKAVKVEKLWDISNEDALKEGIYDYGGMYFHMSPNDRKQSAYPNRSLSSTPRQSIMWVWSWKYRKNDEIGIDPWTFSYEVEVVEKPKEL
jgi:hypothetical protein